MSTLQTIQGTVTGPSRLSAPLVADEADPLHNTVQEALQNGVPISLAAHGAPTSGPAVPPQLLDDVTAANTGSAALEQVVNTVLTGAQEPATPAFDASLPPPSVSAPAPDAANVTDSSASAESALSSAMLAQADTLQSVLEACIELTENPLPAHERTLQNVQDRLTQVQQLQKQLPAGMDAAFLHANLAQMEEQLQDDLCSVALTTSFCEDLRTSLEGKTVAQRLDELTLVCPQMLDILNECVEMAAPLLSRDAVQSAQARERLEDAGGTPVFAYDVKTFQDIINNEIVRALVDLSAEQGAATFLTNMQPETLRHLASITQGAGEGVENVKTLLHSMEAAHKALGAAMSPAQASGLIGGFMDGMLSAEDPGQRLQYADALFQCGYPENADLALQVKLMVVDEGLHKGVEAQHALTLSLHNLLHGADSAGGRDLQQPFSGVGQSLLLTPEKVAALSRGHVAGVNYQLAHLALLQFTAQHYGCLASLPSPPEPPVMETPGSMSGKAAEAWCKALGIDLHGPTASHTAQLAAEMLTAGRDVRALDHLLAASLYYQKGVSGVDAANEMASTLYAVGSKMPHGSHALSLYTSNAAVHARLALDRYLPGLGGLGVEERLENASAGLAFKGATVNAAISQRLKPVLEQAAGRALTGGGQDDLTDRHSALLQDMRGQRHAFVNHYTQAQELNRLDAASQTEQADQPDQVAQVSTVATGSQHASALDLRNERAAEKAERAGHKATRALMGQRLPHLNGQRKEACTLLLAAGTLLEKCGDKSPEEVLNEQDLAKLNGLLRDLGAFDARKLTRLKHPETATPQNIDTVRDVMLPRAKALDYFAREGVINYQKHRRHSLNELNKLRLQEFSFAHQARRAYGGDTFRLVRGAVEAAALAAFLEKRCTPSEFSLRDTENMERVTTQLAQWGLKAENRDAVLTPLLRYALRKVTLDDGTLNFAKLRSHGESLSRERVGADLRQQGRSRLGAYLGAREQVLHSADEATRKEGVHGLMEQVSQPGSGLIIDRTRGVVLDTGALFSPLGELPLSRRSLRSPLSLQLQVMKSDSLAVIKTAAGYQVLLKDKVTVSAALNAMLALDGAFKMSMGGGFSGETMEGLALDFTEPEHCERFLLDLLNPQSRAHDGTKTLALLGHAEQIRFVSGGGLVVNGSVGISAGLLSVPLGKKHALSGTASASVAARHNYTSEVQHNALGQTVTMSNSYLLTATVGVSLGLVNTAMQTLTSASPLAVNRSLSYDMTERYRVETGPHGIGAKTCLEREYGSSAVKHLLFLEELPEDWQRSARADKRFMDKLYKVARDATPATRVTVHRDIRPAVREQVQELLRKARFGNSVDAKKALADAHALLAEDDSYAPAYLMVSRPRRESLGRGFSPGLGIVKVKRSDTLLHLDTEIIPLPKAKPVE